jgi:death-on-curing protein
LPIPENISDRKKTEALHGTGAQIRISCPISPLKRSSRFTIEIIRQFDGAHGILSESTLHFMIFRINKFEDIFRRAAVVLHAIGSQHPFVDGNKRTALLVAENVLGKQVLYIAADEDTIVEFMLDVASYRLEPDAIEQWQKDHAKMMDN